MTAEFLRERSPTFAEAPLQVTKRLFRSRDLSQRSRRYEQLTFSGRDEILRARADPVKNYRPERQPHFRPSLLDPVDRFGAGAQECDSFWILGVQRSWIVFVTRLFRDLPARLGGRAAKFSPAPDLSPQFVFPLHPP